MQQTEDQSQALCLDWHACSFLLPLVKGPAGSTWPHTAVGLVHSADSWENLQSLSPASAPHSTKTSRAHGMVSLCCIWSYNTFFCTQQTLDLQSKTSDVKDDLHVLQNYFALCSWCVQLHLTACQLLSYFLPKKWWLWPQAYSCPDSLLTK